MSLANHLEELQRKHGDIEREIDEVLLHPSADDLEIVQLKRRKLALKDEIEKLKAKPTSDYKEVISTDNIEHAIAEALSFIALPGRLPR